MQRECKPSAEGQLVRGRIVGICDPIHLTPGTTAAKLQLAIHGPTARRMPRISDQARLPRTIERRLQSARSPERTLFGVRHQEPLSGRTLLSLVNGADRREAAYRTDEMEEAPGG
jgi:hypothetical protein